MSIFDVTDNLKQIN